MKQKHNYLYSIFLLLVIVVMSSGISFSRYVTTLSNTGDQSTIIVNKYNLNAQWETDPQALQYPGMNEQSYDFTLENTEATNLSYKISIAMSWNEDTPVVGLNVPLKMELYIMDEGNNLTLVEDSTTNTLYTSPALISGGQDIDFRLKWNWGTSESDRNYKFANKKIDVKIDVDATQ